MLIDWAFQKLKKPRKDGFLLKLNTIYSVDMNDITLYIVYRNEVSTINDT